MFQQQLLQMFLPQQRLLVKVLFIMFLKSFPVTLKTIAANPISIIKNFITLQYRYRSAYINDTPNDSLGVVLVMKNGKLHHRIKI